MTLDDALLGVGLGFELAGLAITAVGIKSLREKFSDRPGIAGTTTAWLARRWASVLRICAWIAATGRRVNRTARDRWGDLRFIVINLFRRLWGKPVHQRIKLESIVSTFGTGAAAVLTTTPNLSIADRVGLLEERLETVTEELGRARRQTRELASGGLAWETVGVLVLGLGLILTTAPGTSADFLRWALPI